MITTPLGFLRQMDIEFSDIEINILNGRGGEDIVPLNRVNNKRMKTLTIEIVSPPDKENLVAEIWQDDQMIAEINQEKETLELEIYINKTGKIKLEFNNFIDTLKKQKDTEWGITNFSLNMTLIKRQM